MNLRRKLIDTVATKEVKEMLKFLDGKKTLIGVVIAQLPMVIEAVGKIVSAVGGDADAYAKVTGGIISLIGLVHKFLK